MPTYTFTRTREKLRDMILRKLGLQDPGETPDAETAEVVYEAISIRLRELHRLGIMWYQVAPAATSLSTVGGTATVSLSTVTDFLFPVSVSLVVGTEDKPLDLIDHRQYQAIPTKTEAGEPEKAFVAGGSIYLWPVPEANGTLKVTYQAISADQEPATAADMPLEFTRSFAILCASDLLTDFSVPAQTAQIIIGQVPGAEKTIKALSAQRSDSSAVVTDYF